MFLSVHAENRDSINSPLGLHIRDVKRMIEIDVRNCNSYSVGSGIGCMSRTDGNGVEVIKLGKKSPCRIGGTVQLDFTEEFFLVGATCGSNQELTDQFIQTMHKNYGLGKTEKDIEDGYLMSQWEIGKIIVKSTAKKMGDDTYYRISIYFLSQRK